MAWALKRSNIFLDCARVRAVFHRLVVVVLKRSARSGFKGGIVAVIEGEFLDFGYV